MENPDDHAEVTDEKETVDDVGSGVEYVSDEEGDESDEEWESDEEDDDDEEEEEGDDDGNDDDDDGDDDNGDEEEDDEVDDEEDAVLEASDSDGETTDRCPICLNRFKDQDIGTPESCDHAFCLECIQEWSMNVNTCPVDRQVFRLILCKHGVDDIIYKKIPVEDTNKQGEEEEEEPTYCEVCHNSDREDRLLLCDGCDLGYHLDCLTPPLNEVPVEEWFCPSCARREGVTAGADAEYVPHGYRRQIPRTLVMERVRSAIEERRVRRTRSIRHLLSSDEEEEVEVVEAAATESASSSTSSPTKKSPVKKPAKRKTPRKYKRKTKRKTTRKRKTPRKRKSKTTGKGKTTKTGKKKTKRKYRKRKGKRGKKSARTAKPSPVTTVKTRIAGALGLSNPPPGRTIPLQKMKQEKSLDMKRTDIGAASLSIFGSRDEIIHFEDEQADSPASESSVSTRKYSRLALSSCRPIGRVPNIVLPVREKKKIVIKTSAAAAGSSTDLLGSIMQDQNKLHISSKNVTIHRDGSLSTKPGEDTKKVAPKTSSSSDSTSLFKSSFTAVSRSKGSTGSVLSSLSSGNGNKKVVEEEYDPAHPTDEMEDEVVAEDNEDVYDPAHPTDDISSDEDVLDTLQDTSNKSDNSDAQHKKDSEVEKVSKDTIKASIQERANEMQKSKHNSDKSDKSDETVKSKKVSADNQSLPATKTKDKAIFIEDNEDSSSAKKGNLSKDRKEIESSAKNISPGTKNLKETISLGKTNLTDKSSIDSKLKKSPSVKITETSKKPAIKPFEISKKTLFEKKRLYGGEIDFSEDVDFSEGAFPETFELNCKRIEEVFKGTINKPESEQKNDEINVIAVEPEKVDSAKNDKESCEKEVPEKVILNKDSKEKSENSKSEKTKSVKENKPLPEDKRSKSEKENKEKFKITGKFKPLTSDSDNNIGSTKISVSDRFKKIKEDRKTPSLEEEDPIHEMRKLDKKLDLEFGNSDFSGKRKDKDREIRKNKRKVSLDEKELEHTKVRKDSRDKKRVDSEYLYEEKEEGEVDDELKLKDKKKKDKRKKKDRDRYLESEYKENADSDIDRRIVIQVSQNTEDRTVWEEAERQRKRKDREERKREKEKHRDVDRDSKKERKSKRGRSRSRSHDRRHRSRSRERKRSKSRSRDRSRERVRRKRRDRSGSRSRDWSVERSRKKKKRDRHRSRERALSREWSIDKSRERSRERNLSSDRERGWSREHRRSRSRDPSEDRVDMFGRSRSPYTRRELLKDKHNIVPRKRSKHAIDDDEVIEILDSSPPLNKPTYDEVSSSESEKDVAEELVKDTRNDSVSKRKAEEEKIETISRIEVKESGVREVQSYAEPEDKDDDSDDEPEETEQFQYTDRDEFIGQNTSRQMRQNLITIGVSGNEYDPSKPTGTTSPAPPLPEPIPVPTPPLPPVGDFTQFPPPPPGPPPGSVLIQDHPPVHVQVSGPPGQGILGEGPILIQGHPPPIEAGPPPGLLQQRPPMSVPVNINVLPPGFHRGLPPTISPQRQVLVRSATPNVQRLTREGAVRFSWQVTTNSDVISSQFRPRIQSPTTLPLINGPFDGLPPPISEPLNLPPGHHQYPPPTGEPHLITIKTDTPPPNIVHVPMEVNEAQRHLPPPGAEPQLIHLGPDPRAPPPRLPIPLLPPSSEPPPLSAMVSIPPPNSALMSFPPPSVSMPEPFPRTTTPPNSVSAILGLARLGTGSNIAGQVLSAGSVNGDGEVASLDEKQKAEKTLNELEKINELLNTQAQLMAVSKDKQSESGQDKGGKTAIPVELDVFKVPLAPAGKSVVKNEVDATEVVDMDMGSPINEEGNIELPVSPQFDNLIDNPEDLLEEDFNKKMQKLHEKDKSEKDTDKPVNVKVKEVKTVDTKKDSPVKTKEEKRRHDKHEKHDKRSSKENKSSHKSRKHKPKPEGEKDLKEKALKDAHFDIDSQDVPSSAVEMTNKEKYLKKLHLQERVIEEVKMAIKPFYSAKKINKEQYKEILRKAVPKICHSKSGNINPMKIKGLVEAYVDKYNRHSDHSKKESDNVSPDITTNGERAKVTR